jgi:hypothetical protein
MCENLMRSVLLFDEILVALDVLVFVFFFFAKVTIVSKTFDDVLLFRSIVSTEF